MDHQTMNVDPLSHYEYPLYNGYPLYNNPHPYNYQANPIKQEESLYYNQNLNPTNIPIMNPVANSNETYQQTTNENTTNNDDGDVKPNISKKRKKKNGEKSTYCSEKITDSSFLFYGCSVCNVSYGTLTELDEHVTIHKDRMTSYRLRLRNQYKKKLLKKEKKKLKKLIKIKKEEDNWLDFEIKPEEGFIGNDKASEFTGNNDTNSNNDLKINKTETCNDTSQTNIVITTNNDSLNNTNSNDTITKVKKIIKSPFPMPILIRKKDTAKTNGDDNDKKDKENNMDQKEMDDLQKIYKCFACQKQFTLSYYLKLHVRSHTDEKPYTCSVCGQSFITASKLGRHNKRIHLASRFQCRICFKIFLRFELLTAHFDKKHADDKLEGEPYDYNAILPYLNELEDQLKLSEAPKTEDLSSLDQLSSEVPLVDNIVDLQPIEKVTTEILAPEIKLEEPEPLEESVKYEFQIDFQDDSPPKLDIVVENIKIDRNDDDVKVKLEVNDDGPGDERGDDDDRADGDDGFGDNGDGDVKSEESDEDYFPSNTWAAPVQSPPSGTPPKRRAKVPSQVCEICNKRVSSVSYMRIHLRTHTGEKPFKCHVCERAFITSSKMNRHALTHRIGAEVKTENPDIKSEAEAEEEKDDGVKKKKKKTKSKKVKKEDLPKKKEYIKRPLSCEFCQQKFLHLETLEVHKQSHQGETPVYRCNYCLEEFPDAETVRQHEGSHTGPKPYLCTTCGKCYTKKETMVYHKKHHKPDREFVCDICSKRFNAACKLTKHLLTHRADKYVLRYECPVCAHMFNTKYHVQMHLATHQKEGLILEENRNEVLAMVLQNARKIPKQPDTSKNLSDIIPSDERSRICNICGEIFQHFYYLEEHLKSHGSTIAIENISEQEEKKYICPICSKGFKLHYYLKLHSFTHSKEKPFQCHQCTKGFITKGKLKRHLETHSGLKKYQCHICYKFFTRPSYLRIHIRTIHGAQDYNFRFNNKYLGMVGLPPLSHMSDGSQSSLNASPQMS